MPDPQSNDPRSPNPWLSVFARHLNEEKLLPRFLANHLFADEIILVDGGSTDDSFDVAHTTMERLSHNGPVPELRWVEYKGGSVHSSILFNHEGDQLACGYEHARGDWVLHMDVDMLFPLDLQENIRAYLKALPPQIEYLETWGYHVAPGEQTDYVTYRQGGGDARFSRRDAQRTTAEKFHCSVGFEPFRNTDPLNFILLPEEWSILHFGYADADRLWRNVKKYRQVMGPTAMPFPLSHDMTEAPLPPWAVWREADGRLSRERSRLHRR